MITWVMLGIALASPPSSSDLGTVEAAARSKGKGKGKKRRKWKTQPYVQPEVGVISHTDADGSTTAVIVGGEGGFRYWQKGRRVPKWRGRTRAQLHYLVSGGDAEGMEMRLGSFLGPWWRNVGVETGPDLFWNRFVFDQDLLEPTTGLGWPFIVALGVRDFSVHGGVEPSWLDNEDRQVDWSEQDEPGFGHEFAYLAGASIRMKGVSLGAGFVRRITVIGVQQSISVGFKLRG